MAQLRILIDGTSTIRTLESDEAVLTVGRDSKCDLRLDAPGVSALHALLRRTPEGWTLEDCESSNGLWQGGDRVARAPLAAGRSVTLGRASLDLAPEPAKPAPGGVARAPWMAAALAGILVGLVWLAAREVRRPTARTPEPRNVPTSPQATPDEPVAGKPATPALPQREDPLRHAAGSPDATAAPGGFAVRPSPSSTPPSSSGSPSPVESRSQAVTPGPAGANDNVSSAVAGGRTPAPGRAAAETRVDAPREGVFPTELDAATLVRGSARLELADGSHLEGTVTAVDRFRLEIRLAVPGGDATVGIPVENLRTVNGRAVHPDWRAMLGRNPEHAAARRALGFVHHGGAWRTADELRAEGLFEHRGEWLGPEELARRGLARQGDEWLSERDAKTRQGMVPWRGSWVTPEEKRRREAGLVPYLGVWVPATVAYRIHRDQFYERFLQRMRSVSGDLEAGARPFLAAHLARAQEAEGRVLTLAERQEETSRLLAIARAAREADPADLATSLRVRAEEAVYRTTAERHGAGRWAEDLYSVTADEDRRWLATVHLLEALDLEAHEVWHLHAAAVAASRLRLRLLAGREPRNRVAESAFGELRDALVRTVFSGFDLPAPVVGTAGQADGAASRTLHDREAGLRRIQAHVRLVLGEERWDWACAAHDDGMPARTQELKARALQHKLDRGNGPAPP